MKVLKFGGTSVGSAQRMKQVADIIRNQEGRKIVVLSAMSGTTNKLVELAGYLAQGNKSAAQELIANLLSAYKQTVADLYKQEDSKQKGLELLNEHFSFLKSLAVGEYRSSQEKTILAQGELLSTQLTELISGPPSTSPPH